MRSLGDNLPAKIEMEKAQAEFFPDTRWSLIQSARSDGEGAGAALEEWCQQYLNPIQTYVQSRVRDADQAEELTQEFFQKILIKGVGKMLPEQLDCAFRAHLMRSIRNFLTDRWRHEQSQRQGGKVEHVSADALGDIAVDEEPRKAFDQSWALNLMSLALQRMGCEMAARWRRRGRVSCSSHSHLFLVVVA